MVIAVMVFSLRLSPRLPKLGNWEMPTTWLEENWFALFALTNATYSPGNICRSGSLTVNAGSDSCKTRKLNVLSDKL